MNIRRELRAMISALRGEELARRSSPFQWNGDDFQRGRMSALQMVLEWLDDPDASCTCDQIRLSDPNRHFKECPRRADGKDPLVAERDQLRERVRELEATTRDPAEQAAASYPAVHWRERYEEKLRADAAEAREKREAAAEKRRAALAAPVDELIDRSSLGTPEAKAVRAKTRPEDVARVMARVKELDDEEAEMSALDALIRCSGCGMVPAGVIGWKPGVPWYCDECRADPRQLTISTLLETVGLLQQERKCIACSTGLSEICQGCFEGELGKLRIVAAEVGQALRRAPPHRHADNRCCNPECGGQWGTGCYCCHHGKYHPALAQLEELGIRFE